MGFTGQALVIGCALLAPMVFPQTIGPAFLVTNLTAPIAPLPPRPPGPKVIPTSTRTIHSQIRDYKLTTPLLIPEHAQVIIDDAPEAAGGGGITGGTADGIDNGIIGSVPHVGELAILPPPPHPPEPVHTAAAPVPPTVSVRPPRMTQLKMATPIHRVDPIYPKIAKDAHISGTVELLGVLGTDGRIHELKVLRGHPFLITAALVAVRQWIYEPTMLNGLAVEVSAPIIVNFILN